MGVKEYFSNCYIEAKKAEKKGCKVIKLGYLYTGSHLFPHYFWYDPKTETYSDFRKSNQASNNFFYKGYVRCVSKNAFARHLNRLISRQTEEINKETNIAIMQNNLDGGTNLYLRDFWFEPNQCLSGKILYVEKINGEETYKVEDVENLEPVNDGDFTILKKLADNKNVIGWMYWNVIDY